MVGKLFTYHKAILWFLHEVNKIQKRHSQSVVTHHYPSDVPLHFLTKHKVNSYGRETYWEASVNSTLYISPSIHNILHITIACIFS